MQDQDLPYSRDGFLVVGFHVGRLWLEQRSFKQLILRLSVVGCLPQTLQNPHARPTTQKDRGCIWILSAALLHINRQTSMGMAALSHLCAMPRVASTQ